MTVWRWVAIGMLAWLKSTCSWVTGGKPLTKWGAAAGCDFESDDFLQIRNTVHVSLLARSPATGLCGDFPGFPVAGDRANIDFRETRTGF